MLLTDHKMPRFEMAGESSKGPGRNMSVLIRLTFCNHFSLDECPKNLNILFSGAMIGAKRRRRERQIIRFEKGQKAGEA